MIQINIASTIEEFIKTKTSDEAKRSLKDSKLTILVIQEGLEQN